MGNNYQFPLLVMLWILHSNQVLGYGLDSPCNTYHVLDMKDLQRHVNYQIPTLPTYICDMGAIDPGYWYRMVHNGTNYQLPSYCLPIYSCGTYAPVWMVGNYPTQDGVSKENDLCANYGTDPCVCQSLGKVDVMVCEQAGHGGQFFVHQFDEIPGCPTGFCAVDGQHAHDGNIVVCDDQTMDCDTVTIVVNVITSDTAIATCVFTPQSNPEQQYMQQARSRTATTVQCHIPTTANGIQLYDRFNVDIYVGTTVFKENVFVLIHDSACQTCDNGFCVLKDGKCFVNGKCCEENQCLMCNSEETPTQTDSVETPTQTDSEETPTQTDSEQTPTQTDSEETPAQTDSGHAPIQTDSGKTPTQTDSEETPTRSDSEETPTQSQPGKLHGAPKKTDNTVVIAVVCVVLVVFIVVAIIVAVQWKKIKKKLQQSSRINSSFVGLQQLSGSTIPLNPSKLESQPPPYTPYVENSTYEAIDPVKQGEFEEDTQNPAYESFGMHKNAIYPRSYNGAIGGIDHLPQDKKYSADDDRYQNSGVFLDASALENTLNENKKEAVHTNGGLMVSPLASDESSEGPYTIPTKLEDNHMYEKIPPKKSVPNTYQLHPF